MSEELENLMQDFCYVEGCQALYKKENYIEYCRKCEYNCPQFQVVEQFVSYGTKIENQVKQLQQIIDKAIEFIKENTIEESNGCGYKWEMIHNDYLTNNINQLLEILKGDSND